MMQRACGARTSSRASRRPWPSTRPAAGARSSCRTRARCTVRALQQAGDTAGWMDGWMAPWPSPALCPLTQPVGEVLAASAGESRPASLCLGPPPAASHTQEAAAHSHCLPLPHCSSLRPGGFGVTQWAQKTGSVQLASGQTCDRVPTLGECGEEA
jgi:hypothetical protein